MENKIILIAGGTASGKTMIADILQKEYTKIGKKATLMGMDNYYISLDKLPEEKGEDVNWDSPNVLDWDKFISDIKELKRGNNIKKKPYNFAKYEHVGKEIEYESSDVIIIEGLFTLYNEEIRKMSNSLIYVKSDSDIRLMRRIKRDGNGRYKDTFNVEDFLVKWKDEIKPMHKKYVLPTSDYADFIIANNKDYIEDEKQNMINLLHSIMIK